MNRVIKPPPGRSNQLYQYAWNSEKAQHNFQKLIFPPSSVVVKNKIVAIPSYRNNVGQGVIQLSEVQRKYSLLI